MPTHLREILEPRRQELVDAVVSGLRASGAPHYQTVAPGRLATRAARLVDSFVAADGEAEPFIAYIQQLSHERITEGYYLHEIQTALTLLDERAWAVVAAHAAPGERDDGVLTVHPGPARQDVLLGAGVLAAQAVVLFLLLIVEHVHVDLPHQAAGTAVIQLAFSTLSHVRNSPCVLTVFLMPRVYMGEKANPSR